MSQSNPFTIYNASAGSGKTFSLVKSYLVKLLTAPQIGYYKQLLAITFTNKAVAEMKERIIKTLVVFSSKKLDEDYLGMQQIVLTETGLTQEQLQTKSKNILKHLLHNYAQFSVETIDHFNHRLIRTFARDLNLSSNFEVSLDVSQLVAKAVDQLIDRAGENEEITQLLLEFALSKTDDDKSWDISYDLNKTASLLTKENEAAQLSVLKDKTLDDFLSLRKHLKKEAGQLKKEAIEIGQSTLALFQSHQLTQEHFSGKHLYNFFVKISKGNLNVKFTSAYLNTIGEKPVYPKTKVKGELAQLMDSITPTIGEAVLQIKKKALRYLLLQNVLKNLVPLATLNLVNQELQLIKEEENLLPINEFNALINEEIKDQPAPFIYERLGDRYRDFFIDEFQDTSKLQWDNLIPLIDNALSQDDFEKNQGSSLIVGDAKQSIYRWRGGLPEQFMSLYQKNSPFSIPDIVVVNLDTNYRSRKEIVDFTNTFFSYVANHFGDENHQELYKTGNDQKHTNKEGGYVKVEFIEAENAAETHEVYPQKVYETIQSILEKGFSQKDICILTRKKKEGIAVSEFLSEMGVKVISEETLLLNNSPAVQCVVNALQMSLTPQNEEVKIKLLTFLFTHLKVKGDQHNFFATHIHEPLEKLSETLLDYSIVIDFNSLQQKSLFESCETIIEQLKLHQNADAFLSSFVDLVFNFSQRPESGKAEFLTHWETQKEKASIAASKGVDAVKVMTIHKSKGLEFPIVIFPYADLDIYKELEPTTWYPLNENGFEKLLINYKNDIAEYGEPGAQIVAERRNTLELDNLNLLYVALTRPEQQLYIFAQKTKPKDTITNYNGFLQSYLENRGEWNDDQVLYEFGDCIKKTSEILEKETTSLNIPYIVSSPKTHGIKVVKKDIAIENEDTLHSIRIGNLLHDTMALIENTNDLDSVLEQLKEELSSEEAYYQEIEKMIKGIVNHPDLNAFFNPQERVLNERDIITKDRIIRPDRINIHPDKTATLIDYKTGNEKSSYIKQVKSYAAAIEEMGYPIKDILLVYCSEDGILINKA